MTIYETIKAAISVKQAAEHYGLKAVSYTHLDVYKRQVEYSKSICILHLQRQSFFRSLGGILFYYAFKQRLQRCLLREE